MSRFVFEINTVEDAKRSIHLLSQTGCDFRIPFVQACLDRRICHFEVQRAGCSTTTKRFMALAGRRPTVLLVGDDDDEPTGPAGWSIAQRVLQWADVVVLHATGAERWHYETTVNTAERYGRVLMVECCTATLPAWIAATKRWAPRAGVQILQTRPGEPAHPIACEPETVQ